MKQLCFKHRQGFTIIEMLVVITIIGIITSIVIGNLPAARAKARDAGRASDIARIQLALQLYFDRCREYPSFLDVSANNSLGGICSVSFGDFISQIPTPPSGTGETAYAYSLNSPDNTDYVLRAELESSSSALRDSFRGSVSWDPTFSCDTAALYYCVRPK